MAIGGTAPQSSGEFGSDNAIREFHFSTEDFERVRRLIYQHAGISLSSSKQEMVYSRLARRLRARKLRTFKEYLALLESNDATEWEAFTNSLTTNLTSFFREAHHFDLLAQHVGKIRNRTPITIWCSASSTGEEPYSLAMTMVDVFGSFTPPVRILATDLDTNVLETARHGVYALERLEKMPPEKVQRFFLKGSGNHAGQARVRDELRDLITFRRINLLDATWPVRGPLDAIFCRNVMIYFDKETQYRILKKFVPLLRPDGLLFAGHSENFYHATDLFRLRGKTVYELTDKTKACHDKRL
ncbi:MAG: CheR family methyltransferase [Pseudomonadota bacterium]